MELERVVRSKEQSWRGLWTSGLKLQQHVLELAKG